MLSWGGGWFKFRLEPIEHNALEELVDTMLTARCRSPNEVTYTDTGEPSNSDRRKPDVYGLWEPVVY